MSTLKSAKRAKKAFWLRWPFLLATIPLTLFALCLIALAIHEKIAADQIEAEVARIHAAGLPMDNASTARWFLEQTSQEGTRDWAEIIRLAGASERSVADLEQIPYVGMTLTASEIISTEQWLKNTEVAEYLRWRRPLIEKIHQATQHPTPVYLPIKFRGLLTLMPDVQASRAVIRLLQLEVEDALHHRDVERIMRGLESMEGVVAAFDWPICMICDLIHNALRQVHLSTIRRSLTIDIWNKEQLQMLVEQVGQPQEFSQRWQSIIAGDRALMFASIANQDLWRHGNSPAIFYRWVSAFPSTRLWLLNAYHQVEGLGKGGLAGLSQRAAALEQAWRSDARPKSQLLVPNLIYRDFMPAFMGYAGAIAHRETFRRLTLTALAIKQFQLQYGRWPDDLTQLAQVGLNPNDWQTVNGDRFGYEVAGDTAYLWSYDLRNNERHISATRPEVDPEIAKNFSLTMIR